MNKKVKVIYATGHLRSISVDNAAICVENNVARPCPSVSINVSSVSLSLSVEHLDIDLIVQGIEDHRRDGALYTTKVSRVEKEMRVLDALRKVEVGSRTMINNTIHVVTAVSTLWGKAAVRPVKNKAVDFTSNIAWIPVENVARNLICA